MSNYYRSTRNNNGRYGRNKIDWTKLADDLLMSLIGIWITATVFDLILKAHGM